MAWGGDEERRSEEEQEEELDETVSDLCANVATSLG